MMLVKPFEKSGYGRFVPKKGGHNGFVVNVRSEIHESALPHRV